MKRLKVILRRDPVAKDRCMPGLLGSLVDADTGDELNCVTDFKLNVPMDGVMTVTTEMVVSEIEVK